MKKRVLTTIVLIILAMFIIGSTCFAKNYAISFTLYPNGASQYSGQGVKGDNDTKCYITTTGGTAISNNLTYRLRAKAVGWNGNSPTYANATTLGAFYGKITSKTLTYIDQYYTQIKNGNYASYKFVLAASLHSGTPANNYTISGKWNP